ncbi:M16 family metallopeptidase [Taibaiella soli]|uniref:Insulinase family protein n=1 Tax=Taibaiella soli TaxID=1649169 RepID=A0A2W2AGL0_9BACT|nr:pitrilysin family protein [Taibaiella soli]PZF74625.1 insulinase family protein [Taibaiella soli]
MKKRNAFYAFLVGASLLSAGARAEGNIKFTEYDMPNGLHVILHEDHATPIVAMSVMYHVGSKNEDPQRTGFAHFFEHLLFEGSENIKRGEYMKLVQANGGELNANTTQDRTFYYEVLPSNQLELALWMESERMLHAKIDTIGVETQRKVVKEEKKQSYDNRPYGQLLNVVYENSFTVHPYRWTPIGKEQYIDQATLGEFMDFYKTFYVPNNAVVVIGGDINIEQSKALITKYFGDIPRGTKAIPRPTAVEPAQTAEKRVTFYDNVQLPAVLLSYHTPKIGTDDYYAIQMLTQLLSQGNSSRFHKEIVDKQQKAVEAGAFALPNEDPSLAVMFSIANMNVKPAELEKAMEDEIEKVKTTPLSNEEYQKLINQAETDFVAKNQKVLGVVTNLATYWTFEGNANLINTELDRYRKITKEDLQRVANKYFTKENRLVVYYLPKSEEKK